MQDDPRIETGPHGEKDRSDLSNTVPFGQKPSLLGNVRSYLKGLSAKRKRRKKEKSDDPYIYPMF